MLYDCVLEVEYTEPTPFIDFSLHNPKIEINYWCNSKIDLIEIRGAKDTAEELGKKLNTYFQNVEFLSSSNRENTIVLKICKCHLDPLDPILDRFGSLDVPPINICRGIELHRIIFETNDKNNLIDEIRKMPSIKRVSIKKLAPAQISKHLYPLYLSVEDLTSRLSQKQLQALTMAFANGYYEIPRKTIIENMANDINIHRRTFEEHLRKGENTLMAFIVPILQIISHNLNIDKKM